MTRSGVLLMAAMAWWGCARGPGRSEGSAKQGTAKAATAAPAPTTVVTPPDSTAALPPMPPYPEARRGQLSVISAGPAGSDTIVRAWPAVAGLCDSPPRMLIRSEQPGAGGTILLLELPESRVTSYPIQPSHPQFAPPSAKLGVQVYSKTGPLAYQATDGLVEVGAFGQTVSGHFSATLREVTRNDRLRYVGAFREVPIARLDSARCAPSVQAGASTR